MTATRCPNCGTPIELLRDQLGRELLADYDRRRSTRHGRLLLWLLRKTT